jgi:mRNA interferase ChpB
MERGDIWNVDLSPTVGHEQTGRRFVFIVSPGDFNRVTRMPVVAPITTVGKASRTAGFAVNLQGAGTRTTGVIQCDQVRALDMRARNGKRIEVAPDFIINEVLGIIATFMQ